MHQTAGQRIRQAREDAGYNQSEFAKLVGCARSTLSEIETGESKLPSAKVLQRMVKVLGKSSGWIIEGKDGELHIPSQQEQEILGQLRQLSTDERAAVLATLRAFLSRKTT